MDSHQLLKFAAALVFVLALMGGLNLILRRLKGLQPMNVGRQRRLAIIEILPVDARRKLILLRRDGREHLILLGHEHETVIETGIESAQDIQSPASGELKI